MLLSNGQQVKFCQCSGSTSSLIVDEEKYCLSDIVWILSQEVGWEEHLWDDLFCAELDVKP